MNGSSSAWVVIPVRPFAKGKRRLAAMLSPEERAALARAMFEDVLACLGRCPEIEGIAVVTDDPDAAAIAAGRRAFVISDPPRTAASGHGLNASLEKARRWLRRRRREAVMLVLPADIPAVTPKDIAAALGKAADVVLVRADDGGTNALRLGPGASLPFAFGPESFERHSAAATSAGLRVRTVQRAGLSLDIDRPADIASYLARGGNSRTFDLLRRIDAAARLGSDARTKAP